MKYYNNKTIYVKHINLLYKLATCFDPYRAIIIISCFVNINLNPNNVRSIVKTRFNKKA